MPEETYDKYEHICKTCKVCAENATPPARSRVSGIRAENFGDVLFVDYAEIRAQGNPNNALVLLILDGATNYLWVRLREPTKERKL